MNHQRLLGAVLLVVGLIFLIVGIDASRSITDRWSNFFTGHFTDVTQFYMLGGAASAVAGGVLFMFGGRKAAL